MTKTIAAGQGEADDGDHWSAPCPRCGLPTKRMPPPPALSFKALVDGSMTWP